MDFYDVEGFVNKISYVLDNPHKTAFLKCNARRTILDKYNLKELLPQHIDMLKNLKEKQPVIF